MILPMRRPPYRLFRCAVAGRIRRELIASVKVVPGFANRQLLILLETLLQHREAALYGRPRAHRAVPALDRGVVLELLTLKLMRTQPRVGRHVCDRIVAGEIFSFG